MRLAQRFLRTHLLAECIAWGLRCLAVRSETPGAVRTSKFVSGPNHRNGLRSVNTQGHNLQRGRNSRLYNKELNLLQAKPVCRSLASPDLFRWASLISAHTELGHSEQAIQFYHQMRHWEVKPNDYVFVAVLKACARVADLASGRLVHSDVVHQGSESNVFVGSSLVHMYSKCGCLLEAQKVFDKLLVRDVVTWNAIIAAHAQHGTTQEALRLYVQMLEDGDSSPDGITFMSLLKACGSIGSIQELHGQILERGLERNVLVGSTLIDMYAKCGSLAEARKVFDRMPRKNVVTWSAMISGYAENDLGNEALDLYAQMELECIWAANHVTYMSLLKACTSVGAINEGKRIHSQVIEKGIEGHKLLGTALVNFYAKCGSMRDAQRVFDRLSTKDVVTWNALINGYGQQNDCRVATECFEEMLSHGIAPDGATFIGVLVACSHVGWQVEGRDYFRRMVEEYVITPELEHYTCMVDMFSRSGFLDEAHILLHTMPADPDSVGWMSLLTACKTHGDVQLGSSCFDRLVKMDPKQAAGYVLMTDIYADAGMWEDVKRIGHMRQCAGAQKQPAVASIEVDSKVHRFTIGDNRSDTSAKLRSVNAAMLERENVTRSKSHGMKGDDALCGHAEKLAIAFGLLNTPSGSTLLITKNLRMCSDCHTGSKLISQMEKREIIVRDAHSVHHFKNGSCFCERSR